MGRAIKLEILKNIRAARRSHVEWVNRAKSLVNGFKVNKDQNPIEVTSCEFGTWFYCDGQILLSIFKEEAVKALEDKHTALHDAYMKIFKIYFDTSNCSLWSKLMKKKKKISKTEEEAAILYLEELEVISNELVSYLNIIEKKITTIDEEKFEKFL